MTVPVTGKFNNYLLLSEISRPIAQMITGMAAAAAAES